jgi:hypothetical protein
MTIARKLIDSTTRPMAAIAITVAVITTDSTVSPASTAIGPISP